MAQHHQPQTHVNTYLASRSQPAPLYAQQPTHSQHSPMMVHQQQHQQQATPPQPQHQQQPTIASAHHPRPSLSPQPAPLNNTMRTTSVEHTAIQPPSQQQPTPPPPPAASAGFVAPSSQVRSSALVNDKKPPNLRVQIPNEDSSTASTVSNNHHGSTTASTNNGMTAAQAATHMRQGKGTSSPTSALPSQFAQNLPSPFSIYPEFLQQNELPSPLNFSATPTTSSAFHWPAASSSSSGPQVMSSARMPTAGDYRPSPLANSHPMTVSHQKRPDTSDAENQRLKKIKLEAAV